MNTEKKLFVTELSKYISDISCKQLSNFSSVDKAIYDILGMSKKDLDIILEKIVIALPDYIFVQHLSNLHLIRKLSGLRQGVLEHLTKEFILFHAQEDINSTYYADNLVNFIYEIVNTINQNYNYHAGE